jgi:hypothetical protein
MNPSFSSPIRADLRLVLAAGRVTCTYNNTTAIKSIKAVQKKTKIITFPSSVSAGGTVKPTAGP